MAIGMYLAYGSYAHAPGEVEYSRTRDVVYGPDDSPLKLIERWDLTGWLRGTSPSDINTQVQRLEAAYAIDRQDIGLFMANGQLTHMALFSGDTLSGTKVVRRPSFPTNRNAAYCTFLPYSIAIEAEIVYGGGYLTWEETVEFWGGGPRTGFLEPLAGKPQKQLLKQQTVYHATQSGSAVGLLGRPDPPPPLWPNALTQRPRIAKRSPQRRGGGSDVEWPISWQYEFESAEPIFGEPHFWGGSR